MSFPTSLGMCRARKLADEYCRRMQFLYDMTAGDFTFEFPDDHWEDYETDDEFAGELASWADHDATQKFDDIVALKPGKPSDA